MMLRSVTASALSPAALAAFDEAWSSRWPKCRPIGHELRTCAAENWVRFDSLPESKRYADNPAEYAEILHRHRVLLEELASLSGGSARELRVVTAAFSGSAHHAKREPKLADAFPAATPWRTVIYDDDPEAPIWWHLYVGEVMLDCPALERLLLLVADDKTSGVIITDNRVEWLYHPYDGGADVIAPTSVACDVLREKCAAWLSSYPSGS